MEQNQQKDQGMIPHVSAEIGSVPHVSEEFRSIRKDAEDFRTIPHVSERKQNHTLTVREVSRMFESAGVARTERSITNWCQPNKSGIARLDAYFDPNERRYFITSQSVELAIQEERARTIKDNASSEASESVPKPSEEPVRLDTRISEADTERIKELELEILDLRIANRGKDYFIEELRNERRNFAQERQSYVEKLMTFNHKVGELETKLLQLEAPQEDAKDEAPHP